MYQVIDGVELHLRDVHDLEVGEVESWELPFDPIGRQPDNGQTPHAEDRLYGFYLILLQV